MKASMEGRGGSESAASMGGVEGGVGWPCWLTVLVTWASHRMTCDACWAKYVTISRETRCVTNSSRAARLRVK